jgi:RNA polymerase sigma factor (sigma-70 family)
MNHVLRHLRRAALLCAGEGPSDEQLLESFLVRRDEASFEALLRRHGPMVLGVCQRVLRNVHDAEDAFQATFLVLARKAGSIRSRQVVASWLYGVAYRTAMKARVMNAKRRSKERQAGELPRPESSADDELLAQLDHELNRLPDKYRVPVVLCELEGRSRKEVARILGVPEGTLSWRLAQAKKLLAKKLSRFERAIPLGALAVGLSPTLRASTLKAALTAGTVPAQVLVLTEGVMKAMLLSKLKISVCVAALALVAGVGASGVAYRVSAQEPTPTESVATSLRNAAGPPATDEMEALRLEIEALRKSLQATRERVKTLEGEVSALKGKRGGSAARMGLDTVPSNSQGMGISTWKKSTTDPVSDAGAALEKLRANPSDKNAVEALERALKRLKEREKPQQSNPRDSGNQSRRKGGFTPLSGGH